VGRVTAYTGLVSQVLDFLVELDGRSVPFTLARHRRTALLVTATLPGQRWEVEFTDAGEVEVEVFRSDGAISDVSGLADLWLFAGDQ
jgi:hypothetical protein